MHKLALRINARLVEHAKNMLLTTANLCLNW